MLTPRVLLADSVTFKIGDGENVVVGVTTLAAALLNVVGAQLVVGFVQLGVKLVFGTIPRLIVGAVVGVVTGTGGVYGIENE